MPVKNNRVINALKDNLRHTELDISKCEERIKELRKDIEFQQKEWDNLMRARAWFTVQLEEV